MDRQGFYSLYSRFASFDFDSFFKGVRDQDVLRAAARETLSELDFLALLSERARDHLETIARRSQEITVRNFGKVIQLYAPLYLANFCDNECVYCGFKQTNPVQRKRLSIPEVEQEAAVIRDSGIRHILILTGESRRQTPVSYLKECVLCLRKYFSSISIEVYPLEEGEYGELAAAGVDGLTLYQETYDEGLYRSLHTSGPKRDFRYRLDAPERACRVNMRCVGIGTLLGLAPFRREAFFTGMHAAYLQTTFPGTEIGVSIPRIQPQGSDFSAQYPVGDREFVQILLAVRLFLPRASISVSTREESSLRSRLIGLGVTRMSAGSSTQVGGYALSDKTEGQFKVADTSAVGEVKKMIREKGYQPVLKDWETV